MQSIREQIAVELQAMETATKEAASAFETLVSENDGRPNVELGKLRTWAGQLRRAVRRVRRGAFDMLTQSEIDACLDAVQSKTKSLVTAAANKQVALELQLVQTDLQLTHRDLLLEPSYDNELQALQTELLRNRDLLLKALNFNVAGALLFVAAELSAPSLMFVVATLGGDWVV